MAGIFQFAGMAMARFLPQPSDHQLLEVLATTFPLVQASVVSAVLEQCEYDALEASRCLLGLVEEGNVAYDEDPETQAAR